MELADEPLHEVKSEAPVAAPATPSRSVRALRWARARLIHTSVLLVFAVFVFTDLRGVDFGFHWDETDWHVKPTRDMVASGVLLPHEYLYPSFTKWMILLPAVPAGIRAVTHGGFEDGKRVQAAMLAVFDSPKFLLWARSVFIVVSALGILWIYGAALALGQKWWAALIAAASFGLSWEIAYHARFLVTDTILVQFSALTVFMLALYHRRKHVGWLYAATVAAGLGTGTKYPGVFLLLPVVLHGALTLPRRPWQPQVRRAVLLCAVAFAVYMVTTPGTVLDPIKFITETQWISKYYSGTHGGYTATSAWDHGRIVLMFLSLSFFSHWMPIAAVLFAGVVAGAVLWVRDDRRFAAVLLSFPVAFLVFFCAKYRVTIVRNYLFVTPVMALLLARAVTEAVDRLPRLWARLALGAVLAAAFAAHAVWLVRTSERVSHVDPRRYVNEAISYVRAHPKTKFRLSPTVRSMAASQLLPVPPNAPDAGPVQHVVFFARGEGPDSWHWTANDPWLMEAVFGPTEINFDYFQGWAGHDRIVVMTFERAKKMGVQLAK